MKKVLIIYGSIGLGHKIVAENIGAELAKLPGVEVVFLDMLELYRGKLVSGSGRLYERIVKSLPFLWRFFYTNKAFLGMVRSLRLPFASIKSKKFAEYLKSHQPDLILTTHPTATALTLALKKKGIYHGPIVTTFSDFHFQPFWVYPGIDKYLVMTAEQKTEMEKYNYPPEKVVVTGLPVHPVFSKERNFRGICDRHKLSRTKPIVLVMGGSRGWGITENDIVKLLESDLEFQIAVITGLNLELQKKIEELGRQYDSDMRVFGNWSNEEVAELFCVAKILVTKPGGLTIAQAILKNLPMILINPFPAMEELNQDYLVGGKAAVVAKNSEQVVSWVERLLKDKELYQAMKTNLKKLSVPNAAKLAAGAVIDILNA